MGLDKKYLDHVINRFYRVINDEYNKGGYERVLSTCSALAALLYQSNQYYYDDFLETTLYNISKAVLKQESFVVEEEVVLFYDGFGIDNRGLVQIYLDALSNHRKIIYVTYQSAQNRLPNVLEIVKQANGIVEYIDDKESLLEQVSCLDGLIKKYKPANMFFYTMPNDVVGFVSFVNFEGFVKRYQINLTDHAFWLGIKCCDYCVEFRNYGATITHAHREVPMEKMVMLPYYPKVAKGEFQGYPDGINENTKFVFSGGALYKTLGADNKYYRIVDEILENYPDICFWYAGSGNRTEMDKLIVKYPGRVILTEERKDFVEAIKRSVFYLSTYPVCGGLMFQYVAVAGKLPLTLKYDDITDDFLLEQDSLYIVFDTIPELMKEIEKILSDENYREERERVIVNAVISKQDFDAELESLLTSQKTSYSIELNNTIKTKEFRAEYLERMSPKDIELRVVSKKDLYWIKYFPVEFIKGVIHIVIGK